MSYTSWKTMVVNFLKRRVVLSTRKKISLPWGLEGNMLGLMVSLSEYCKYFDVGLRWSVWTFHFQFEKAYITFYISFFSALKLVLNPKACYTLLWSIKGNERENRRRRYTLLWSYSDFLLRNYDYDLPDPGSPCCSCLASLQNVSCWKNRHKR